MMCSPPEATTALCSFCQFSRTSATRRSRSASVNASSALMRWISGSGLPPSTMSVPRPAMLVAMVTWARASRLLDDLRLARVLLGVQHVVRHLLALEQLEMSSEFSTEVVPTRIGWPLAVRSFTSLMIAWYFSLAVMKTWSFRSFLTIGGASG
jgi:hypothetical protein